MIICKKSHSSHYRRSSLDQFRKILSADLVLICSQGTISPRHNRGKAKMKPSSYSCFESDWFAGEHQECTELLWQFSASPVAFDPHWPNGSLPFRYRKSGTGSAPWGPWHPLPPRGFDTFTINSTTTEPSRFCTPPDSKFLKESGSLARSAATSSPIRNKEGNAGVAGHGSVVTALSVPRSAQAKKPPTLLTGWSMASTALSILT